MLVGKNYKITEINAPYDAIVIGSGMGGLSTAAILAKAGWKVLVLERHYTAGGFTHTYFRKGYEWDVGVHYIGGVGKKNSPLLKTFNYITDSQLKWAAMDDTYDRIIFGPQAKDQYDFVTGPEKFQQKLEDYFPEEKTGIRKYLQTIHEINDGMKSFYLPKAIPPWLAKFLSPLLSRKFKKFSQKTTLDQLKKMTSDPKLIAVLTGQYGDYGLPPSQSSFAMHAILVRHYLDGGFYPVGGASQIAKSILPIIEKSGGKVLVRAEVDKVLVRNGKAIGVKLKDGEEILSKHVISNAGIQNTFSTLLDFPLCQSFLNKVQQLKPSIAHLCLYIGLKGNTEELGLKKTNLWIYPGYDHDRNFQQFLNDADSPFPVCYISFPSAKDPDWSQRFPGKSTIEVITLGSFDWFKPWAKTEWHKRGQDYENLKAKFAQRLLEVLYQYVPQTRGKVDYYELSTPLSTQHFCNYSQGEIYGLRHDPERFQKAWLTPYTPIKNLFLTGQDIATAGVASALMSGVLTASAALKRNVFKEIMNH